MLNVQAAIVSRLKRANPTLDYTIADLTIDQLHQIDPGSTIGSPASIHFHVSFAQDLIVNELLRGETMIFEAQGWAARFPGIAAQRGPATFAWAEGVRVESAEPLLAYAAAVRNGTYAFIEHLSDDELAAEVEFFTGPAPLINVLLGIVWETGNHTGELAALRGRNGLKGLPF